MRYDAAMVLWIPALLGCCLSLPALAADKPVIAILSFRGINTSAGDAEAITEFIRNAVVELQTHVVVEKANMDKLLAEQSFQQTGCTAEACAVKLGKILNAQKVIVGSYTVFEGTRMMSARVVDVETGVLERAETEEIRRLSDIMSSTRALVRRLLKEAGSAPRAVEEKAERGRAKPRICVGRCGGPRRINPGDTAVEGMASALTRATEGQSVSRMAKGSKCGSVKDAMKIAKASGAIWVVQVTVNDKTLDYHLYDVTADRFVSKGAVASVATGPIEVLDMETGSSTWEEDVDWVSESIYEAALAIVDMVKTIETSRESWVH